MAHTRGAGRLPFRFLFRCAAGWSRLNSPLVRSDSQAPALVALLTSCAPVAVARGSVPPSSPPVVAAAQRPIATPRINEPQRPWPAMRGREANRVTARVRGSAPRHAVRPPPPEARRGPCRPRRLAAPLKERGGRLVKAAETRSRARQDKRARPSLKGTGLRSAPRAKMEPAPGCHKPGGRPRPLGPGRP